MADPYRANRQFERMFPNAGNELAASRAMTTAALEEIATLRAELAAARERALLEAATETCYLCREAMRGNANFSPAAFHGDLGWRHRLEYRGRQGQLDFCSAAGIHRLLAAPTSAAHTGEGGERP